ncbi:MAG TPA: sigma-70 family RNA polymerase sigma factor [Terracidiphilus sp.]|nr:sigma-70 family RNA polymerase sigma factor [Terracidiphilus sp.]
MISALGGVPAVRLAGWEPEGGQAMAGAAFGGGWERGDRPHPAAFILRRGKPGPEDAGAGFEGGDFPSGSGDLAQPSGSDGVPEDMATLVLDNPVRGAGKAARLDPKKPAGAPNYAADDSSDAAIMLRVAAGDESGFNFLVEKHYRAVIHFLFRMVRNQAVAEELAQEVFLRVYRSRESYRAEAKFTTWLFRIATNLAVNHARDTRHERNAQTVYLDAPDPETGTTPDVADDDPNVEQNLLRDERMAAIRQHVMALPERQRMAVLMHKYQGMDYRQIGDVLKLSESATKSLLFRAYQTLREKLKDFV